MNKWQDYRAYSVTYRNVAESGRYTTHHRSFKDASDFCKYLLDDGGFIPSGVKTLRLTQQEYALIKFTEWR